MKYKQNNFLHVEAIPTKKEVIGHSLPIGEAQSAHW